MPDPAVQSAHHRGSSFALSFLFLPGEQRRAIERLYAFCRLLDDATDEALAPGEKKRLLEFWRRELEGCYTGHATHPVAQALMPIIHEYGMNRTYFEELLQGVEMDLTVLRYPDFIHLSQYCYRVAGTVGLLCLPIFGCPEEKGRDYAVALGIAFQLTNILRDVKDDAGRGRIYLPMEDLRHFDYSETELLSGVYNDRFASLMRFEAERARDYFRRAADLVRPEFRRRLIAPEIMAATYFALLRRIESSRYNVFERHIRLSLPRKVTLALKTAVMNRTGIGGAIRA